LGTCSDFQAFPGHGLKCNVTGVSQFVKGNEENGDASVAVKLIGEGLQSKTTLVGVADSMQQYQVVLGNRRWLGLNGFELSNKVDQIITNNEGTGQTVVLVGINGMYHDVYVLWFHLNKLHFYLSTKLTFERKTGSKPHIN